MNDLKQAELPLNVKSENDVYLMKKKKLNFALV
jgi:hypothetical protein